MRSARSLLLALLLLTACGSGRQDRPEFVAAFPVDSQALGGPLGAIRITYDEEVVILNPASAEVFANGIPLQVILRQRNDEPCCVYVEPEPGFFYPQNAGIVVQIERGAVINAKEHYAKEPLIYQFTTGADAIYLGRGGVVTAMNGDLLTVSASTPTPGGRTAVGIQTVAPNDVTTVFVQLADGGGAREALAHFAPGAAAMIPIALSTSTGAGDLTATMRTIEPGQFGRHLYTAFRDETNGTVRLHRIDMATATEIDAVQLSVPAGPDTRPLGLVLDPATSLLYVACADGATGRQAYVNAFTMVEMDRDPVMAGTQALVLPSGAGPIVELPTQAAIVPLTSSAVTFSRTPVNGLLVDPSNIAAGLNKDVLTTADKRVLIQTLTGYASMEGLVARTADSVGSEYLNPGPLIVEDGVGAGSTGATTIAAMAPYPSDNRFLGVLDTDVLVQWIWNGIGFEQNDLDPDTDGIQGVDISVLAPGVTTIGRAQGAYPSAP